MFTLKIKTENAAFEDNLHAELARIMREIADSLDQNDRFADSIRDLNGNRVGEWKLT